MNPYRKPRTLTSRSTAGTSRDAAPAIAPFPNSIPHPNKEHAVMNYNPAPKNTAGWVTFSYVSFAISTGMMALGIWALPADLWVKGYLLMASLFMLGATFTLAKTVRDEHESKSFANRLEDAKTERLLMEVGR